MTTKYFLYNEKLSNYLAAVLRICKFVEALEVGAAMNRLQRDAYCELCNTCIELAHELGGEEMEVLNAIKTEVRLAIQAQAGESTGINRVYADIQNATNSLISEYNRRFARGGFPEWMINYRLVHKQDGDSFEDSTSIEDVINDLKIKIMNLDRTVNGVISLPRTLTQEVPVNPDREDKAPLPWQGTSEQKDFLFSALADNGFLSRTSENKANFLKNVPIRWIGSGRDLFYLMDQLKKSEKDFLDRYLNLAPFIDRNFVDKKGQRYKNINQNIWGSFSVNISNKPKGADILDGILKTLLAFTV